jgi:Transposase DDE domain group 1
VPVMGFVSFNDEAEQNLSAAKVTAAAGAVGILRSLMQLIRYFLPRACIRVRLDGGVAHPQVLAFLDAEPGVDYVVAMAKNTMLKRKAKRAMRQVRICGSAYGGSIGYSRSRNVSGPGVRGWGTPCGLHFSR